MQSHFSKPGGFHCFSSTCSLSTAFHPLGTPLEQSCGSQNVGRISCGKSFAWSVPQFSSVLHRIHRINGTFILFYIYSIIYYIIIYLFYSQDKLHIICHITCHIVCHLIYHIYTINGRHNLAQSISSLCTLFLQEAAFLQWNFLSYILSSIWTRSE